MAAGWRQSQRLHPHRSPACAGVGGPRAPAGRQVPSLSLPAAPAHTALPLSPVLVCLSCLCSGCRVGPCLWGALAAAVRQGHRPRSPLRRCCQQPGATPNFLQQGCLLWPQCGGVARGGLGRVQTVLLDTRTCWMRMALVGLALRRFPASQRSPHGAVLTVTLPVPPQKHPRSSWGGARQGCKYSDTRLLLLPQPIRVHPP